MNTGTQLADLASTVIANLRQGERAVLSRVWSTGSIYSGRPGYADSDIESLVRAGLIAAMATVGGHTRYELTLGGAMIVAAFNHRVVG